MLQVENISFSYRRGKSSIAWLTHFNAVTVVIGLVAILYVSSAVRSKEYQYRYHAL